MNDILSIGTWFTNIGSPVIIAGPCSAESEAQVLATARAVAATGRVHAFRAGVWKPRSRPGTFSGEGSKAIEWMIMVKEETGLPIAMEAGTPRHVEEVLKSGVADIIWIGSRTVTNPFSVEEIASALIGSGVAVLIKNPLTPDIDLWSGAVERIYGAGIRKLAVVHRGFSPFERTSYRNMPKWEVPIEMRRRFPLLPVICDPSHLAGDAMLVPEVAQKALDLGMSGLMVEVHANPKEAKSDAMQQLSPQQFTLLLESLIIRKPTTDDPGFRNQLEELRNQIDSIDYQLIDLLAARMNVSRKMGEYKCRNNVTILQMERWLEILRTRIRQGTESDLDAGFVESLMKLLHQESIRNQTEVMNKLKNIGECRSL